MQKWKGIESYHNTRLITDDPYTLEEIHDTTHFVLHGTASYTLAYDEGRTHNKDGRLHHSVRHHEAGGH